MNPLSIALRTTVFASMVLASLWIETNPVSAQQRACVITDEGNTVCGKLTTQTKKSTATGIQRKEYDKFVFTLKGCRRTEGNIKCGFTITNKLDRDRVLDVYTDSSLVDSQGKSYTGSNVEIGGKSSNGRNIFTVSPGIDYESMLTFENVPEQISQVPLLNIKTHSKLIQFRNVSFSN
jgi:hypothetical protein